MTNEYLEDVFDQVHLIYAYDLQISISSRPGPIEFSKLVRDQFRNTGVRGIQASGKGPALKKLSSGEEYLRIKTNLIWWVNGVEVVLHHKSMSNDELQAIAVTMLEPVGHSEAGKAGVVYC